MPVKIWANGSVYRYSNCKALRDKDAQKRAGNTKKTYKLKWRHYRAVSSACVRMFDTKQNNITFWTFTTDGAYDYPAAVKLFSRCLENLKKTYGLVQYVWTGELQKNGNPHFHAILDIPYVDVRVINAYWNDLTCMDPESPSVRLPKKKVGDKWVTDGSVVVDVQRLVKYVCKYMSKQVKSHMDMGARVCAMSKHLANAYETFEDMDASMEVVKDVEMSGFWTRQKTDFCDIYTPILPFNEIREFINRVLPPIRELEKSFTDLQKVAVQEFEIALSRFEDNQVSIVF